MPRNDNLFQDPDSLRKKGWLPQSEAARLLGLPPTEMISWDFIDAEQRTEDGGNWVKLLPEVAAKHGLTKPPKPSPATRPPSKSPKSKIQNPKIDNPRIVELNHQKLLRPWFNGAYARTVREAAEELGVSAAYIQGIARNRLNAIKREGILWIPQDEIDLHRWRQERWAELGGQWTSYGRKWKKGTEPVPEPEPELTLDDLGEPVGADVWITAREAAAILGFNPPFVNQLARQGKLNFRVESAPDSTRGRGHLLSRKRLVYNMAEVLKYEMRRAEESWKRNISPKEWNHDRRRPILRSWRDIPPTVNLISARKAAQILGVSKQTLAGIVKRGRLFIWSARHGKRGAPTFNSEDQVMRYASNPDRLARRAAYFSPPKEKQPYAEDGLLKEWADWQEDNGLLDHHPNPKKARDVGEFYTTRQAAQVLGVSASAVRAMRDRRRIKGYRSRKTWIRENPNSYWFFKKEDIHALLHDEKYRRLRDDAKRKNFETQRRRSS